MQSGHKNESVEEKLNRERGNVYGPHQENASDFAAIKAIFDRIGAYDQDDEWYIVNMIQKFIRIANSPYYKDSHDDLRTYDKIWWEKIEAGMDEDDKKRYSP